MLTNQLHLSNILRLKDSNVIVRTLSLKKWKFKIKKFYKCKNSIPFLDSQSLDALNIYI